MKAVMTVMYVLLCVLATSLAMLGVSMIHAHHEQIGVVLIMAAGYLLVTGTMGYKAGCDRVPA